MQTAPQPRKGFQNLGFDGVLSSLSFAGERKGAAGGIFGHKECGAEMYPPVTASPCQPPLGKGAEGTGGRIATASLRTGLAMTGGVTWGVVCGGTHGSRPTAEHFVGQGARALPWVRY